jgi:hypothetical protein
MSGACFLRAGDGRQREFVRRVEEGRAEMARVREEARRRAGEARAELEALILGRKSLGGRV